MALSKMKDTEEEMFKDRKTDDETLDAEKQKISGEDRELNQKLETGEMGDSELSRHLEDMESKRDDVREMNETGLRRIEDAEKISADLRSLVEGIEKKLAEVNAGLEAQTSEFKSFLKQREAELSALAKKIDETNNEHCLALEQLRPREMEYSTFSEQYKLHQDETLAQTKELEAKVTKLESELTFLLVEKIEMEVDLMSKEKQLAKKTDELDKVRAEMLDARDQVFMIQKSVAQREISLQVEHETRLAEDAAQIAALVSQVNDLEVQLDSLQTKNNQMLKFEKERQELQEYLSQLGADNIELRSKTTDLRGNLDKVHSKVMVVRKQLDDLFQEHKISPESKYQIMADLEQLSEGLKRELEVKGDEISYLSSLVQKSHDIDFQLRPKPGVTEELLTEKEHNYRTAELKDQESKDRIRDLEVKGDELSSLVQKPHDTEDKLRAREQLLTETEQNYRTAELKCQEDQKVLEDRIAALSGIISATKVDYQFSIGFLSNQLDELDGEVLQTRERVEDLETEASKKKKEKSGLIKAVNELEKMLEGLKLIVEKENEVILDLVTKKREAIRQL